MFTSLNFNASGENTPSNKSEELDMNLPLLSTDFMSVPLFIAVFSSSNTLAFTYTATSLEGSSD
jgi:hypothetical protein